MKKDRMIATAALGAALAGWLAWGNSALEISAYTVTSPHLPEGFHGFRIAQISDFHNAEYGTDNEKLLSLLAQTQPDIIVITGDIIDSRRLNIPVALAFAKEAAGIAPCYYVTGNHESRIPELPELMEGLVQAGVTVLRNGAAALERNGQTVTLLGVEDPAFHPDYKDGSPDPKFMAAVTEWSEKASGYTILLSHRPEWFDLYRDSGMDLVFSGHVHGGQFRIPFLGGFYGPNQGFFPQYDAGTYTEGDTTMVVSRGVGPSIIPLRINNRPEIVVAELQCQKGSR